MQPLKSSAEIICVGKATSLLRKLRPYQDPRQCHIQDHEGQIQASSGESVRDPMEWVVNNLKRLKVFRIRYS